MDGKFDGNDEFQKIGADYYNPEAFTELVNARRSIEDLQRRVFPIPL